jgi:hypothetical protein
MSMQAIVRFVAKYLLLSAIVGAPILMLSGCTEIQFLDKDTTATDGEQTISMNKVEVQIIKEGEMQQKIEAQQAHLFEVQRKVELDKLGVTFYSHDKPVGVINSDEGILYLADDKEKHVNKNDFILLGHVRYVAEDGTVLETKEVSWNNAIERIISPFAFTQRKTIPEGVLLFTGKGFETDKTFSNWVYKGGEMTIEPSSETQKE